MNTFKITGVLSYPKTFKTREGKPFTMFKLKNKGYIPMVYWYGDVSELAGQLVESIGNITMNNYNNNWEIQLVATKITLVKGGETNE